MARNIGKALIALFLGLASSLAWQASDAQDPRQTGPVAMIIQYKCLPGHRANFRRRLFTEGLRHFAQRQSDGMLTEYHILFSRYSGTSSWDALALLTFRNYDDVAHWRRVEQNMTAGLPDDIVSLTINIDTYPVDLMRQAISSEPDVRPVYMVVPYSFNAPPVEYMRHIDEYVAPQFAGWIKEGILSGYRLYTQRYSAARPWDSLVVLRYKDDQSLGQRERIAAKVRAELQNNPVWKAAGDDKQNLRAEKEAIIADELTSQY